jgi:hypothetical protein
LPFFILEKMEAINENSSIKKAYLNLYSHDELANELNDITFLDLFYVLENYKSVYKAIGVYDSIIRENIFSMLAIVMNVDYNYIYEQWLKCKEG